MNKLQKIIIFILALIISIFFLPASVWAKESAQTRETGVTAPKVKAIRKVLIVKKGEIEKGVELSKQLGVGEVADGIPPALKDKVTEDMLPYTYEEVIYETPPPTFISVQANGEDVAEFMKVDDPTIEEGDVVSVSLKGLTLVKAGKPYDRLMLGIISTSPGITLGDNQASDSRQVALVGRVPVKVSTENGPIEPGDYLTSSSIPGVAMKATRAGPTVGKALESFDGEGIGKIMAFVNVSYADPGNFFASLSFDESGNLIIPKIKVGSLILDESVASASASLVIPANAGIQLSESSSELNPSILESRGPPRDDMAGNVFYDLSGKIASIEERIKQLEDAQNIKVSTIVNSLNNSEATQSATPSATLAEATNSAQLADSSDYTLNPNPSTLDLTPPDILLQDSAILANLKITSEATVSGMLAAYDLSVSNIFKSLGETTLATTNVAGDLTVDGTLSLTGNSINTLGTLFLQNSPLAQGLDIFSGKVTVDKDGILRAQIVVADQYKVNEGKSSGTAKILAGQIEVEVQNPLVEENSIILITPNTPLLQTLAVTNRTNGSNTSNASFTVKLAKPEPVDISFDYLIIGQEKLTQL